MEFNLDSLSGRAAAMVDQAFATWPRALAERCLQIANQDNINCMFTAPWQNRELLLIQIHIAEKG